MDPRKLRRPNPGTTARTTKGYLRVTAGPCRWQYVHRIVAEALLGRPLRRDEEVHHRNGDRRDPRAANLLILGSSDHGWLTAKQNYFMKYLDDREKKHWDGWMIAYGNTQSQEIAKAKVAGVPWQPPSDGSMQEAWQAQPNA